MTIEDVNDLLTHGDGLLVTHLDYSLSKNKQSSMLFDKLAKMAIIVLVRSGSAEIEIDYKMHYVNAKGNNLIMIGKFNKIGQIKLNKEFMADCLTLSRKFVSAIIPYRPGDRDNLRLDVPITNIIAMRDNPTIHIEEEEKQILVNQINSVEINSGRMSAPLRIQILYVSAVAFLVELMNIVMPKYHSRTDYKEKDRKLNLVQEFSNILFKNFKKEHSVTYYSDKLCISAQYLSKATKSVLGVSASKVIADMIITEAVIMLRTPDFSIQQIAQELGFSDQSSFGKFFKKNHGVSPQSYRKKS